MNILHQYGKSRAPRPIKLTDATRTTLARYEAERQSGKTLTFSYYMRYLLKHRKAIKDAMKAAKRNNP